MVANTKEYMKNYIQQHNNIIICECGSRIKQYNNNHKFTNKHILFCNNKKANLSQKILEIDGKKYKLIE